MKKLIALFLTLTLCVGCFAACGSNTVTPTTPTETTAPIQTTTPDETTTPTETTSPVQTTAPTETFSPETTVPVESIPETTAPAVMSDDPFDFEFSIDGTTLKLPCDVADLQALGYLMPEEDADNTLDEHYIAVSILCKNDYVVSVHIYNTTETSVLYADAPIDEITFDNISYDESYNIRFYGGIQFGSTKDEVLQLLGEPTKTYGEEDSSSSSFYYEDETGYQQIVFRFWDDIVIGVTLNSDAEYQR